MHASWLLHGSEGADTFYKRWAIIIAIVYTGYWSLVSYICFSVLFKAQDTFLLFYELIVAREGESHSCGSASSFQGTILYLSVTQSVFCTHTFSSVPSIMCRPFPQFLEKHLTSASLYLGWGGCVWPEESQSFQCSPCIYLTHLRIFT